MLEAYSEPISEADTDIAGKGPVWVVGQDC